MEDIISDGSDVIQLREVILYEFFCLVREPVEIDWRQ